MYAKYVSLTTSVQAEVIADLALLLTGSPISALSASCDKVNTTLLSTVAPGWTLVDAAAPLSGQVISAPDIDNTTTKFGNLYSHAATYIGLAGYEAWNAVAHTGTNATGVIPLVYSATAANTYVIFATPRSFYISSIPTAVAYAGVGIFEFTRECEYLKGSTYPCFAVMDSMQLASPLGSVMSLSKIPRTKNLIAAGDLTGAGSGVYLASLIPKLISHNNGAGLTVPVRPPNSPLFNATGVPYYELRPLWALSSGFGSGNATPFIVGAVIGKFYDLLETSFNAGNNLDTFSNASGRYAILHVFNNSTAGISYENVYAFKMA